MKPPVYIGVETKVREFDAKLLLACVAAEAGYDVTLGKLKIFKRKLDLMAKGIFIDKSMTPPRLARYAVYKKLGFKLVVHDEEGLAPWNDDEYLQRREIGDAILAPLDYFFTWGQPHADLILRQAPSYPQKLLPVGNPRVDLTRRELRGFYNEKVEQLRQKYGRMVLLNSNFALGNHFHGKDGLFTLMKQAGRQLNEQFYQFYRHLQGYQEQLFDELVAMVDAVQQRFPDITLVVRPHPSEDHEHWRQALPQTPRVQVVHEGNVIPWLMAADVVVHNSCTTGIEALLLERPVLAYHPIVDKIGENYLATAVSEKILSLDRLLARIDELLVRDFHEPLEPSPEAQRILNAHITGRHGDWASDRIVHHLDALRLSPDDLATVGYRWIRRLKHLKGRLLRSMASLKGANSAPSQSQDSYTSQKFPATPVEDVQRAIMTFQHLTGRFAGISATQIEENLFRISRKAPQA